MPVPRIRHAFGFFGDLRIASLTIFIFLLVVSLYFTNKYLGMNIHSRVLAGNTGNLSQDLVGERMKNYVTVSEKGSFVIGSIGAMYLIISIYGFVAIIANEIYILITPMVMFPLVAFIMVILIFFDLGIQESTGFLFFWVLSGFVIKILAAVASIYSFIVVFSYYMEVTQGPLEEAGSDTDSASSFPGWSPRTSPERPKTPPPTPKPPPLAKLPQRTFPPEIEKTPPPRPPPPRPSPPKMRSPKPFPARVKSPNRN